MLVDASAEDQSPEALIRSLSQAIDPRLVVHPELAARYDRDWTGDHIGRSLAVVRPQSVEDVVSIVR